MTFNRELAAPGASNATTFTIDQSGTRYEAGAVTLDSPTVVRVEAVNPTLNPGGETIDYDDALTTLVGVNGLRVEPFTGLPCPPIP